MLRSRHLFALFLLLFLSAARSQATTYFVTTAGTDVQPGTSWKQAVRHVQTALNLAGYGDQVWVAAGFYVENVVIPDGVQLYGGFSGKETDPSQRVHGKNITTLDGGFKGKVVEIQEQVDQGQAITLLDGFTIQNGNTVLYGSGGGGIDCPFSSATITNNIVKNCQSSFGGGLNYLCGYGVGLIANNCFSGCGSAGAAIQIEGSAGLIIDSNKMVGNDVCGLQMFTYDNSITIVTNNEMTTNTGQGVLAIPGDSSSITVQGNLIHFNRVGTTPWGFQYGGGITVYPSSLGAPYTPSQFTASQNTIAHNSSGSFYLSPGTDGNIITIDQNKFCDNGDTVYLLGNGFSNNVISFTRNLVEGNEIGGDGGAITVQSSANPTIADNLIVNNFAAGGDGGAIYVTGASAIISNNTIVGNMVPTTWGGGAISVANASPSSQGVYVASNIIYGNSSGVLSDGSEPVKLLDNFITGNTNFNYEQATDLGNIEGGVPGFVNVNAGNYHLVTASPCIDAGFDGEAGVVDTDLDGNPRIVGQHVDIGCYEVQILPTKLTASSQSGTYGQTINITATLSYGAVPLSNEVVVFQIDGGSFQGAITSNGVAGIYYTIPTTLAPGSHTITATFGGDGPYQSSTVNARLTVREIATKIVVQPVTSTPGAGVDLFATLTAGGVGLPNEGLNFFIDNQQVFLLPTGSDGSANHAYILPSTIAKGNHLITVKFGGDGIYASQAGSAALKIH